MDLQQIKRDTEEIKDKLILNFEYHFNKFLLQDFYEDGSEDNIGKIDEYLYYEGFLEEVRILLFEIEKLHPYNSFPDFDNYFQNLPKEIQETQINLINLKKVIDNKLNQLNLFSNPNGFAPIPLSLTNEKSKNLVKKLYDILYPKYINCNQTEFKNHFIPTDSLNNPSKLIWLQPLYTLTFFIYALAISKNTFLQNGKGLFIKTLPHFRTQNNEDLTTTEMTKNYERDKHKIDEYHNDLNAIEKILREEY